MLTEKEEEILKLIVAKTILEMEYRNIRDTENSNTFGLKNLLLDSEAALKLKCIEK